MRCRIVHATLKKSRYNALSYTWGELIFNKTLIVLGDRNIGSPFRKPEYEIPTTANLDMALRRMRIDYAGKMLLWVDAVCINQADPLERTSQVQVMGQIFSSAKRVLIWTGLDNSSRDGARCLEVLSRFAGDVKRVTTFPYFEDSDRFNESGPSTNSKIEQLVASFKEKLKGRNDDPNRPFGQTFESKQRRDEAASPLQDIGEQKRFVRYKDPSEEKAIWARVDEHDYAALSQFFQRPYFSRRWIIQEISLAKEHSVYCGDTVIDMFVTTTISQVLQLTNRSWAGRDGAVGMWAMLSGLRAVATPVAFLRQFPNFQCRDPKDHVFAMLGVFESRMEKDEGFSPDHALSTISYDNNIAEVYTAFARYQLSYQSKRAILKIGQIEKSVPYKFVDAELLIVAGAMRHSSATKSETNFLSLVMGP